MLKELLDLKESEQLQEYSLFPRLAAAKPNLYSSFNLKRELETFWESGKEYIRLQKFQSGGNGASGMKSSKKLLKHLPLYAEVLAEYFIPSSEAFQQHTQKFETDNTSLTPRFNHEIRPLKPIGSTEDNDEEEIVGANTGSLKTDTVGGSRVTIIEPIPPPSHTRQTVENGLNDRGSIRSRDSGIGMGDVDQMRTNRPSNSRQSRRGTTPASNGRAMSVGSRTGGRLSKMLIVSFN